MAPNVLRLRLKRTLTRWLIMAAVSRTVLVRSSGRAPRLKLISRLHRCMTARKNVLHADILGPRNVWPVKCLLFLLVSMVVDMCDSSLDVVPCANARLRTCLVGMFRVTRPTTWWATAQAPLSFVLVMMSMLLLAGVPMIPVRLGSLANCGVPTIVLP